MKKKQFSKNGLKVNIFSKNINTTLYYYENVHIMIFRSHLETYNLTNYGMIQESITVVIKFTCLLVINRKKQKQESTTELPVVH